MLDYAQESGRAGRDGKPSEAIIMRSFQLINGQKVWERGWNMPLEMVDFLGGQQCRRASLDHFLDGRTDRVSCEEGEAQCDICSIQAEQEAQKRLV